MRQLDRLTAAGLPAKWVAFDEVYGGHTPENRDCSTWPSSRTMVRMALRLGDDANVLVAAIIAVADVVAGVLAMNRLTRWLS